MSADAIIRPAPAVTRNGLPAWKPYAYQGRGYDVLTPELGDAWTDTERPVEPGEPECHCDGSMRAYRRHLAAGEDPCARSRAEASAYNREQRQRNHRLLCAGAS